MKMSNSEIRLVKNNDIDRTKWDECIARSTNRLIYAQTAYLDIIAPGWNGLVYGNYKYIMPLIVRRRLGMDFLLQPIFAQQHGVFPEAASSVQNKFLTTIRAQFNYISIHLNSSHVSPFPEGFLVSQRVNLILNLSSPSQVLQENFSKHCRRQIRKAEDHQVSVIKSLKSKEYLDLKNQVTEPKLSKASMKTLEQLIEYGINSGKGIIYSAYNHENTLCSAAFFLFTGKRVIYLNAASTNDGKANSSMYSIVSQFILEHAESDLILDFEGSSIPGIARFYSGFGAKPELYYGLKLNRLPLPVRWLKK